MGKTLRTRIQEEVSAAMAEAVLVLGVEENPATLSDLIALATLLLAHTERVRRRNFINRDWRVR